MSLYSDLNAYKVSGALLLDHEAVYQALNNILSTRLTERLFVPDYGWEIESLLFEIISDRTAKLLIVAVVGAISKWDDRIDIVWEGTSVTPDFDNNRYDVIVAFSIKGLDADIYEFTGILSGATA